MGWWKYIIVCRWDWLSPFRVTPSWKEGVESKYGKWVSSKHNAYHWEKKTGKFIKVTGDLFYEFDPDETEYSPPESGDYYLGLFNDGNDCPFGLNDDYPDVFNIITSYWEFDRWAIPVPTPLGTVDVTVYKAGCRVSKKLWQVYKYEKKEWVFVKKDKNPN